MVDTVAVVKEVLTRRESSTLRALDYELRIHVGGRHPGRLLSESFHIQLQPVWPHGLLFLLCLKVTYTAL